MYTAEPSGVETTEGDDSPGVHSNLSGSPAPRPSSDVLPPFQHLIIYQAHPAGSAAAVQSTGSPFTLLEQKLRERQLPFSRRSPTEPSSTPLTRTLNSTMKPRASTPRIVTTPTRPSLPDCSWPEYALLPDDYMPHPGESPGQELSVNDEQQGVSSPGADGNSPPPMDTEVTSRTETRNSEAPTTADESTGGTTGRSTSPSPALEVLPLATTCEANSSRLHRSTPCYLPPRAATAHHRRPRRRSAGQITVYW